MKSIGQFFTLIILCSCLCTSCYNYHLVSQNDADSPIAKSQTLYNYLWGVVQVAPVPARCREGGIAKMKVRSTFGHNLITVVTLGMVAPIKIEWYCVPDNPAIESL